VTDKSARSEASQPRAGASWSGPAKSFRAGVRHSSAIYFKRNGLASTFIPQNPLSRDEFGKLALDYMVFGNSYAEDERNRLGGLLAVKQSPAKYVRRSTDLQCFFQIERELAAGSAHHSMERDINQEVYGLPKYLSAFLAAFSEKSAPDRRALPQVSDNLLCFGPLQVLQFILQHGQANRLVQTHPVLAILPNRIRIPKIEKNRLRDARNLAELAALNWSVLTVWECELVDLPRLSVILRDFLETATEPTNL
jgi:hypothetical protein